MTDSRIRILVNVSGGLVQDVACSEPAEVFVIDWDTEGATPEDGVTEVPLMNDLSTYAFIHEFDAEPLTHFLGTHIDRALQAYASAQQGGDDE